MKKRVFVYLLLIFVLIFLIFFLKNNYKKIKYGNNDFNKSVKGIEEYILNIHSYKATIEVEVSSNKNNNKYLIDQEYGENISRQIVKEPENISGIEIISHEGKVEIKNTKLNLNEIYSEYPGISENVLWLNSFIESYKSSDINKNIYEENENIVMEIINENNKYYFCRKLYIDKQTGLPKKMIVQDNDNNKKIYILYKEIIINK